MLHEKGDTSLWMSILYKARQSTDSFRLLPTTGELPFAHHHTRADTSIVAEVQSELYMQKPHRTHTELEKNILHLVMSDK